MVKISETNTANIHLAYGILDNWRRVMFALDKKFELGSKPSVNGNFQVEYDDYFHAVSIYIYDFALVKSPLKLFFIASHSFDVLVVSIPSENIF